MVFARVIRNLVILTFVFLVAAILNIRKRLGIPRAWSKIAHWFVNMKKDYKPIVKKEAENGNKDHSIPVLQNYRSSPDEDFWQKFPKKEVPNGPETAINVEKMRMYLNMYQNKLSIQQWNRGQRLLHSLVFGAPSFQKTSLPPITVPNAPSAFIHGKCLTEKIASWIESGFVAGPFSCPPMTGFRSNALIAIERNGSVRPIVNMSEPEGSSFNDNLDKNKIEKVYMATAKSFSYKIIEAGAGCLMSKYDLKDAYKNIPAKKEDWHLQGFSWLNKYFFETKMIFGGTPSVANFDILGSTLVELGVAQSGIPRNMVSRTLDDIPVISPVGKPYTFRFGRLFKRMCEDCGVKLAKNCPLNMKAFEHKKKGMVLGIIFDTEKLEWSLSEEKADRFITKMQNFIGSDYADLKQTQSVMGVINDMAQLCPLLKCYKATGNRFMASFKDDKEILLKVDQQTKDDVNLCIKVALAAVDGLPIAHRPAGIALWPEVFYSDAAGAKFVMHRGQRVNLSIENDRGVAVINVLNNAVSWWTRTIWPMKFLNEYLDEKGCSYGSKTATLEALGVLLPFLCIPEQLAGRSVVIYVDNMAVVYGWRNGYVKMDQTASILIRAVHLAALYLGVLLHVEHMPRCSDEWSVLADSLSRKSSTSYQDRARLRFSRKSYTPKLVSDWLNEPVVDWELPNVFLELIKNKMKLE
jgi:hypothetical protein